MPRLRRVSGEEAIRALEKLGFFQARQRGSHVVMKRRTLNGETGCTVPLHTEIAIGTLRALLRQAGVSVDEFTDNL